MSKIHHSNGNGNGHGGLQAPPKPARKPVPAKPVNTAPNLSQVSFRTIEKVKLCGTLAHFMRSSATFELYGDAVTLRTSEALNDFQISLRGDTVYSGKAVISNLVDNAIKVICTVDLDETQWTPDANWLSAIQSEDGVKDEYNQFEQEWQKLYTVSPEFKVIVADIQTYLRDLQIWLDQVESKISLAAPDKKVQLEKQLAREIGKITSPKLTGMFEKFEAAVSRTESSLLSAHAVFARRMLHPFLMGSPFLHRTFHKPLGYAGDYEMVNMLSRDPFEGKSLFAKIINLWFWEQPPAEAHRNRLIYLAKQIDSEALRLMPKKRKAHIFNFACGPALEIQNFLKDSSFCERTEFTLADFNGETLDYIKRSSEQIKARRGLTTAFQFQKKSVHQLLKESDRLLKPEGSKDRLYDFVYCAGLFDYLSDRTCKEMMNAFYNFVAPGGLLVVTNVDSANPRQPTMEHIMAWHLIYRNANEFAALRPDRATLEDCTVKADATGVNIFLEVRKPEHG